MLTIFTMPKPFQGDIKVIQTNAIKSWLLLRPKCEVILIGDEEGTAEIASELGVCHIPEVERNEYGTPLVNSMFDTAQEAASNKIMCYVNADIILMSDFLSAVQSIHKYPFLMVGQRWDVDVKAPVDFSHSDWEAQLHAQLTKEGKLHSPRGIDYFVFPRGMYDDIPPFALGRTAWDNWLVYRARSLRITVIDATQVVTIVHQNHEYAHHPGGKTGAFKGPEAERNRKLLGGMEYSFCTKHANWLLTPKGIRRAMTLRHIYTALNAVPALVPALHFLWIPKRIYITFIETMRSMFGGVR
ncbi:hypothetical protein ACFLUO_06775 [Chloroflexota bacterium]